MQRHHFPVEGLPETAHCQGLGTFVSTICRAAAVMRSVFMPEAAVLGRSAGDVHAGAHLPSFWGRCRLSAYHVS